MRLRRPLLAFALLALAAVAQARATTARILAKISQGMIWVEPVYAESDEVVEGTARPLYIYEDMAEQASSA